MSIRANRTTRFETAEHVLPGHPDKLCDAAVDAVVDYVRGMFPDGQCGLEAAAIFGSIHLTGRIAANVLTRFHLDVPKLVREAYCSAGYGRDAAGYLWGPDPGQLEITTQFCLGDFEPGEQENRHLSDDQAICTGYANANPGTNHLPPAHWLARRVARNLFDLRLAKGAGQVGPDGKVLISIETDGRAWKPVRASISLNHHEGSDWLLLRHIAEEALEAACGDLPVPPLVLNGAGMFVAGGPNGDNGLAGKKLVVDAYGPTVPIGGGAWSGKDLHKVDRLGGLLARSLAKKAVLAGLCDEALVTLEYTPGCDHPTGISARLDGAEYGEGLLEKLGGFEVGNQAVWAQYVAWKGSLVDLARWGHQMPGTPWEHGPQPGGRFAGGVPRQHLTRIIA